MVIRALALAAIAAATACVHPDYHCTSDTDCDVGEAGRCEADQRCTAYDPTCATHRRYVDHSGPQSGICLDDTAAPLNLCAAGQPPATSQGCAATVCSALPSCCTTGWSEACVEQAQLLCSDVQCDTRIALTATKPGRTELWDLRFDGAKWTAMADTRTIVLAWLAPPPGQVAPRLAGFSSGALVFDGGALPLTGGRTYVEVTSVDFDRDGRPTAALGFTDAAGTHVEIAKLDSGATRVVNTSAMTRLSWGDVDRDPFPDGIAAAGASTRYSLLSNIEGDDRSRQLDDRVASAVTGSTSSGTANNPPPLRSFDWIDIDGDHLLDAIAFGYSVNVHLGKGDAIGSTVLVHIDCDPPVNSSGCDGGVQMNQAFAGAALPGSTGAMVIATHPVRALWRAELRGTPAQTQTQLMQYTFPTEACGAMCPPIIAVVVRDLDGDHQLDVIAIDGDLQVYVSLATDNFVLHPAIKLATTPAAPGFFVVRTSVSGAPR